MDVQTWKAQHVPARIVAALPCTGLEGWFQPPLPQCLPGNLGWFQEAVHHGQRAALRWLIEFIGVRKGLENGEIGIATASAAWRRKNGGYPADRDIGDFDSTSWNVDFCPEHDGILLNALERCGSSITHATEGKGDLPNIRKPLAIILEHLAKSGFYESKEDLTRCVCSYIGSRYSGPLLRTEPAADPEGVSCRPSWDHAVQQRLASQDGCSNSSAYGSLIVVPTPTHPPATCGS